MSRDQRNRTTRRYCSPLNRLRQLIRRKATIANAQRKLQREIDRLANRIGDAHTLALAGTIVTPTSELDAGTGPALATLPDCEICRKDDCPSLTSTEQCPELLAAHLHMAAIAEGV